MKPVIIQFVHDLCDARGNHAKFLDRVAEAGCHDLHFMAFRASPGACNQGATVMPYKVIGGYWRSSGKMFSLYGLSKNWNPEFFRRLKIVLRLLKERKIRPWITIHDLRQRSGDDKYWHPYYCSKEAGAGMPVDPTPGGVWGEPEKKWGLFPYHRNFIRVLAKKVYALCDDPVWEICNEFGLFDNPESYMIEAHGKLTDVLDDAAPALPEKWTSGIIGCYRNAHWYSAHGVVRPENVKPVPGVPVAATIISGDGGFDGNGRYDKKAGKIRRGASPEQAAAVVKTIKQKGMVGYEILDRGMWLKDVDVSNLDDFDPAALSAACKERDK